MRSILLLTSCVGCFAESVALVALQEVKYSSLVGAFVSGNDFNLEEIFRLVAPYIAYRCMLLSPLLCGAPSTLYLLFGLSQCHHLCGCVNNANDSLTHQMALGYSSVSESQLIRPVVDSRGSPFTLRPTRFPAEYRVSQRGLREAIHILCESRLEYCVMSTNAKIDMKAPGLLKSDKT